MTTSLSQVVPRAFNLVRLIFNGNLDRTSALEDLENYTITAIGRGKTTLIKGVVLPSLDFFNYLDLEIPNATGGEIYAVGVNQNVVRRPIASSGSAVDVGVLNFTAIGLRPAILVVIAPSANQVVIYFNEPVLNRGSLLDISSWVFNGGLTVTGIADISTSSVTLNTSTQNANQLYTLTFNGDVFDNWSNSMVSPSTSQMLGFVQATVENAFNLPQMYNFLFEGLRLSDSSNGELIKRYFGAFQVVWGAIMESIYGLKLNKDPSSQSGTPLRYLANFLGWSESNKNTKIILDALIDAKMRQLISLSPQFWKDRGSPDAEDGLVSLITGARRYTLDWFDVRTIAGEMQTGEDHDGTDPWMVSEEEQNQYNLRVVDDGTLDRAVVRAIARLCRPNNERVLITYMLFIERFGTAGDLSQFSYTTTPPVVSGGQMTISSGEVFVSVDGSSAWQDYITSWKFTATNSNPTLPAQFELHFRRTDSQYYLLAFNLYPNTPHLGPTTITLYSSIPGHLNLLALVDGSDIHNNRMFFSGVNYVCRVHVRQVGTSTQITVYLDGVVIIEVNDPGPPPNLAGTFGSLVSSGTILVLDELEALRLPAQFDLIEINT